MGLFETINEGIKESIRSKDLLRLETLRMLKSKILAVDARGALSESEVVKLFKTYSGNLHESLLISEQAGREEMVDKLKKEIAIVAEFLPKTPSLAETEALVRQAITETQAFSKKDLGIVMKKVMSLNPHADGKLVKQCIDQQLS